MKPENILLDSKGVAKLCDFGISIPVSNNEVDPVIFGSNPDMEGDSKYLATEVLQETGPTQAGDIFALGITLLEMATDLILPNEGDNWEALRDKYLDEKILNSKCLCIYSSVYKTCFFAAMTPDIKELVEMMIEANADLRPTAAQILEYISNKKLY